MRSYTAIYSVGAQSVRQGENHQTRQEKPTDLCEKMSVAELASSGHQVIDFITRANGSGLPVLRRDVIQVKHAPPSSSFMH